MTFLESLSLCFLNSPYSFFILIPLRSPHYSSSSAPTVRTTPRLSYKGTRMKYKSKIQTYSNAVVLISIFFFSFGWYKVIVLTPYVSLKNDKGTTQGLQWLCSIFMFLYLTWLSQFNIKTITITPTFHLWFILLFF